MPIVDWKRDTHALVRFLEEDSTAIVPVNRIKDKEELEYGGSCAILWTNKKVYKAFLICSGSCDECTKKQDELEESECEEAPEKPHKRPRKDTSGIDEHRQKKSKVSIKTKAQQKKNGKSKKLTQTDKDKKEDFVIYVGAAPPSAPVLLSSTSAPTTSAPTTAATVTATTTMTTSATMTSATMTSAPTTSAPTSAPTTSAPTTSASTTSAPTTSAPTTSAPTTSAPTTCTSATMTTISTISFASSSSTFTQDVQEDDVQSSEYMDTDDDSTSEEDEESLKPVHVRVDDGPADRTSMPKHYIKKSKKEVAEKIDSLRKEIEKHHDEQKIWLEHRFNDIQEQLRLITASGVATALMQSSSINNQLHVTSPATTASVTSPPVTSVVRSVVLTGVSSATRPVSGSGGVSVHSETVETTSVTVPEPSQLISSEVSVETSDIEYMSHSEIVSVFTKAKNRPHFAAMLIGRLIDEETRVKSNVRGRGKEKLDPTIVAWVEKKSFEYHPSEGNTKEEWEKCVRSIDGKNRGVKRKQCYKENCPPYCPP